MLSFHALRGKEDDYIFDALETLPQLVAQHLLAPLVYSNLRCFWFIRSCLIMLS